MESFLFLCSCFFSLQALEHDAAVLFMEPPLPAPVCILRGSIMEIAAAVRENLDKRGLRPVILKFIVEYGALRKWVTPNAKSIAIEGDVLHLFACYAHLREEVLRLNGLIDKCKTGDTQVDAFVADVRKKLNEFYDAALDGLTKAMKDYVDRA